MNESQIKTIEDIEQFLLGTTTVSISLEGGKTGVYSWIERTLVSLPVAEQEGKRHCVTLY